jgi:hypothetical protein
VPKFSTKVPKPNNAKYTKISTASSVGMMVPLLCKNQYANPFGKCANLRARNSLTNL